MNNELQSLSPPVRAALESGGIITLEQLIALGTRGVKRLPGIGPARLAEIEGLLDGASRSRPTGHKIVAELLREYLPMSSADEAATRVIRRLGAAGFAARRSTTAQRSCVDYQ